MLNRNPDFLYEILVKHTPESWLDHIAPTMVERANMSDYERAILAKLERIKELPTESAKLVLEEVAQWESRSSKTKQNSRPVPPGGHIGKRYSPSKTKGSMTLEEWREMTQGHGQHYLSKARVLAARAIAFAPTPDGIQMLEAAGLTDNIDQTRNMLRILSKIESPYAKAAAQRVELHLEKLIAAEATETNSSN